MHSIKLKLLYLACSLLIATGLAAQDASYFVYIQHEKHQPFYVKLDGGKLLSSSVKGYLILPRMEPGKWPVTIGFPKGGAPEQQFTIRLVGGRDYGYLLKNTEDQDWALYDLQTFASLKSSGAGGAQPAEKTSEGEAVAVTRISSESATAEQKELINNVQADVEAALAKKAAEKPAEEKAAGEQAPEEKPLAEEAPKAEMPADTTPVVAKTEQAAPKKKNSFAESLDKIVTDDRPADMDLPKPKPAAVTEAPVDISQPVAETEKPKKRKKGQREPLTEEEKALLSGVLEDEKRAAADEALKEAEAAPAAEEAVKEQAPAEEKAPEEKPRKAKKKKDGPEPEFIDFGNTPATTPASTAPVTAPAEVIPSEKDEETDAKAAREARRQQRKAEREAADREALARDSVANEGWHEAAPEAKPKKSEEKKSDLKMVNSDCQKVLETDAFRKLLRTMNSRKTDEDMVDAFRKGTRNTCVSTDQVRALTQLISGDENRYQLMDAAYARTYDSDNFAKLADLLTDDYYKKRFNAMLKR
ncbi:DUF4476 domain-containing protein [Chitinophaga pollutisoli]|uniref:DUF4476 domain-containing protein n=1 Tax=Chitinophaga pollutisoli TaxID=3133966 RepID=A0ABZ2YJ04_9BACT